MSDLFEPDVLASLLRQWSRSLRARNRSPRTVETYTDSAQELAAFARRHAHEYLDRALIEDYLANQAARWKPSTVAFRYRSLQQFTKWLTAEDELPADRTAWHHLDEPTASTALHQADSRTCESRGSQLSPCAAKLPQFRHLNSTQSVNMLTCRPSAGGKLIPLPTCCEIVSQTRAEIDMPTRMQSKIPCGTSYSAVSNDLRKWDSGFP